MTRLLALIAAGFFASACVAQVHTELVETPEGWRLMRAGQPYSLNGAGGTDRLDLLASLGGNSIRTWGQDQLETVHTLPDGSEGNILDLAHAHGVTVCVGYWVEHPRHGFSYDDRDAVEQQLEDAVAFVRKYKDHPAVLMWGVGNEVELTGDTRRLLGEVNRIAKAIKEEDPHHPTMAAIAGVWPAKAAVFNEVCTDVDILGVNVYGGAPAIPQELLKQGYTGPYIMTEFGPIGHWESAITPWGAQVEQTSSGKARTFEEFYTIAVLNQPDRSLGAYAFLWGQKQERTETWYGMLLKTGEKTASADTMSRMWGGEPENFAPEISRIVCDAALCRVPANTEFDASVEASDPDDDALTWRWVVKRESTDHRHGGDAEAEPETIEGRLVTDPGPSIRFRTPSEPGAYRLFVFCYDGKGSAGAANVPFFVE